MGPELTIEDQILLYPDVSPEERRAVDARVEADPALRSLLQDSKAVWQYVGGLAPFSPGDETVSFYATARRLYGASPPERLRALMSRIEAALQADPALRSRAEQMAARADEIEGQSDAVAQLERLTGRRLPLAAPSLPGRAAPPAATTPRKPPARVYRLVTTVTYAAAAVVVFGAVYALLFLGGRALQPPVQRLAWFSPDELAPDQYRVTLRGSAPSESSGAASLGTAIELLAEAQRTTFGLFPRTDAGRLQQARTLLEQVASDSGSGPAVQADALYYLGKARLALGDTSGAQRAIEQSLREGSTRSPEARSILEMLRQEMER